MNLGHVVIQKLQVVVNKTTKVMSKGHGMQCEQALCLVLSTSQVLTHPEENYLTSFNPHSKPIRRVL